MAKLYFNTRDELNRIDVSKIVYFEADGNYTDIVMVNKLRAAICMNLGEMEKALAEQQGSLQNQSQVPAPTFALVKLKRTVVNINNYFDTSYYE